MTLLDRAAFFAAEDAKHEDIPVPQLGGSIRIRVLSGAARDAFNEYVRTDDDGARKPASATGAALLVATCINADGEPMFSMEDIDLIREKSAAALDVLAAAAMRINGMGAKAEEDAAKN